MRYSAGQYWFEYAFQVPYELSSATGQRHVRSCVAANVREDVLEREFGRVHADDLEPLRVVGANTARGGAATCGCS